MAEKDLDDFIVKHLDGNPLFNKEVQEAVKKAGINVSENSINSALSRLERYGDINSYPPERGKGIRVIYFLPKDKEEAHTRYFEHMGDKETLQRLQHEKDLEREIQKRAERAQELFQEYKESEPELKEARAKSKIASRKTKKSMLDLVSIKIPIVCVDGVFIREKEKGHLLSHLRPYIPSRQNIFCFTHESTHSYIAEYPELKQAIEQFWSVSKEFWEQKEALNTEIERLAAEKGKRLSAQERFRIYKQVMSYSGFPPHAFEELPLERKDIDGKVYDVSAHKRPPPQVEIDVDVNEVGVSLTKALEQKNHIIEIIDSIIK